MTSYRLAKGTSSNDIIDENGLVNSAATSVDADVTSGSLTPSAPGSAQSVTVNLRRAAGPQSPPLYFTIGSVFAGLRVAKKISFNNFKVISIIFYLPYSRTLRR